MMGDELLPERSADKPQRLVIIDGVCRVYCKICFCFCQIQLDLLGTFRSLEEVWTDLHLISPNSFMTMNCYLAV